MAKKSNPPKAWKDYLSPHPHRKDYDNNARVIQELVQTTESPLNNFHLLAENKPLVFLTKSLIGKNIKMTS